MRDSVRVAIVGYALDTYSGQSSGFGEEIGYRVVRRARQQAGLNRQSISSVHNATMDLFDGMTISNGILSPAAGGYGRDSTRIQNGGVFAIMSACASILSEASDVAVVSSVDTVTTDLMNVSTFSASPYFEQPLGLNFLSSSALFSSAFMAARDISEEQIANTAAASYAAGAKNRYSHVRDGFSSRDVLQSEMIASPLQARTVALQQSYGAAALIVASDRVAGTLDVSPVYITGFGMSTFSDNPDDWIRMTAVKRAARAAYNMSQMQDPATDVTAVEIDGPFAPFELASYSALELCREGQEQSLLDGRSNTGICINPSGGSLCTNAPNSGGLFRAVQAAMYLENHAAGHGSRAVIHDSDLRLGVAGSSHAVAVLERG